MAKGKQEGYAGDRTIPEMDGWRSQRPAELGDTMRRELAGDPIVPPKEQSRLHELGR